MKKALTYEEFLGIGLKIFKIFAWKSPNGSVLQSIYYWVSMLVLIALSFSLFMFVSDNLGSSLSLLQLSHNFLSLAINALVISRMFLVLYYNYDNLQILFERLRALMPRTMEEQRMFRVEQERRPMAIKNWMFLIIYSWNTFVSTLMPVLSAAQNVRDGGIFAIDMHVELWLPFNQKGVVAQILIFLGIVWWNFVVCTISFSTEIVYITVMSTLCMQFDILRRKFQDVKTERELISLIDKHNELIELSELAKESFSMVILTNFINGTLMLCFLGFCLLVSSVKTDPGKINLLFFRAICRQKRSRHSLRI